MKNLKYLLFLPLFMIYFVSNAQLPQLTIYDSFEDYKNKKGELIGTYLKIKRGANSMGLVARKGADKEKILFKNIWGFSIDGDIYRVTEKYHVPVMLIDEGEICYYENGYGHLNMIEDYKEKGEMVEGAFCYISNDVNSELVAIPEMSFDYRKRMKKLKSKHPEFTEILDCIAVSRDPQNVLPCIKDTTDDKKPKSKVSVKLGSRGSMKTHKKVKKKN